VTHVELLVEKVEDGGRQDDIKERKTIEEFRIAFGENTVSGFQSRFCFNENDF
jgi:hypothetical protein